ncbi:MAG TPA: tetrahydrofolate dehydrogenase/cyclohydrolase catalytic domain-containing protein [Flavilitoribacter sp.]|nr:tetrahydrofolate dehydrogenase/cyclohydrolase catalytic domain-containing protein [Flavilitoribacter sp.]HMQ87274.1 tetrahydrofolate dehydrogenase/cyclohydrolase catalytic domain-containing protein [Flavilitoribacter sp.]
MTEINGTLLAQEIKKEIAEEVLKITNEGKRPPHLAAVLIGEDPASQVYVRNKVKSCEEVGFQSTLIRRDAAIPEEELLGIVDELNRNSEIDGFIVQLPLPRHINEDRVTLAIKPEKDVDGFHPVNFGRMAQGLPCYLPATPCGIIEMMKRYNISAEGKEVVVIGRSNIVGTPIALLLSQKSNPGNGTVTICHSRTKNLREHTLKADILIAAIGRANFVTADMVKEGVVVIDVGINRVDAPETKRGYKLAGDVDFAGVAPKASFITPVPGGVGPMTVVSLLLNTLKANRKEIYP